MLNAFALWLLLGSALSPLAIGLGFTLEVWPYGILCFLVGSFLVGLCYLLLRNLSTQGERFPLTIEQFERRDHVMVGFLLAYLLPVLRIGGSELPVSLYVLAVVVLVLRHSGAYHFNPVMGILGYHFHSVRTKTGMEHVLITKAATHSVGQELSVVHLASGVSLSVSSNDA